MTMKTLAVGISVFLAFLSGCRHADEQNPAAVPPAAAHAPQSESLAPYYYGLIEEYRTILAEDPRNFAALIAMGNAYFDSGQWRESIGMYERALAINPRNADVITDMGTAYRNLGKPHRAVTEYRRALALEPGHVNARYNLGVVYAYDLKDHASAIREWEVLLRIAPNHPEADVLRKHILAFKQALKKGGP